MSMRTIKTKKDPFFNTLFMRVGGVCRYTQESIKA
jgi:hypothetical protein